MLDPFLQQDDLIKKGKVLFLVLLVSFSFLFHKLLGPVHEVFSNPLVLAFTYGLLSTFGFLWSLSFQMNVKILFVIAPQLGLVIFSQIFFLEMLFAQTFGRLYETLLMIALMISLFSLTYIIFLTSNVFAVSSFKKIPLEAVAKTTIYLMSSISVFFATYAFFSMEIFVPMAFAFLVFFLILHIFFLLAHFYLEISEIFYSSSLIFWNVFLVIVGAVLYSSRVEFVALLVTTVFYFATGLFINKREQIFGLKILEYIFILLLIAIFATYFSF